jgi:hypothetical protein
MVLDNHKMLWSGNRRMPKRKRSCGAKKAKVKKVMGEYKRGKLRSSSGGKVRKRSQAVAIALSEARRGKK